MLQPIRNSFSRNFQSQNTEITNKAPFTIYQSSNFTQTNKRNLKSKSIDFLKRNFRIKKKTESLKMMNQFQSPQEKEMHLLLVAAILLVYI